MRCNLVLVLIALSLIACDDDSKTDNTPAEDTATMQDSAMDEDTAEPDTTPPIVYGTVEGNIFWNQPDLPDGSLLIALVTENPATTLDETFVIRTDPAVLPTSFTFENVPSQTSFYLMAFFDVGRDSSFDAPGTEDYLGITSGAVGISADGDVVSNINVELR